MSLQALIFDIDGTFANTEEAHRCAFNEAFRQHGLRWHWNELEYAELLRTTGGKERLIQEARSAGVTLAIAIPPMDSSPRRERVYLPW